MLVQSVHNMLQLFRTVSSAFELSVPIATSYHMFLNVCEALFCAYTRGEAEPDMVSDTCDSSGL